MKVLVAGASGTLGEPLLRALHASGHTVVGIARTERAAQIVRDRGAEVVIADVLDRSALLHAVTGIEADAVLHELTALKKTPTRFAGMRETNDLRTAGSANLIEAGSLTGATRFVTQSIVFGYGYADLGAVDEDSEFGQEAGDATDETIRAMLSAEQQAFGASGMEGIALRYGLFYGANASVMAQLLNHRSLPVPSHWRGTLGFIHHADAAAATVAALEHGSAGRAYNVVDDHPFTWRGYVEAIAAAHHTKQPLVLPDSLLRLVAPYAGGVMTRVNMQVSNDRARRELGWRPQYPSVLEGLHNAEGR